MLILQLFQVSITKYIWSISVRTASYTQLFRSHAIFIAGKASFYFQNIVTVFSVKIIQHLNFQPIYIYETELILSIVTKIMNIFCVKKNKTKELKVLLPLNTPNDHENVFVFWNLFHSSFIFKWGQKLINHVHYGFHITVNLSNYYWYRLCDCS